MEETWKTKKNRDKRYGIANRTEIRDLEEHKE
jgi:hypothetical protein